jgi:hypothetical protein
LSDLQTLKDALSARKAKDYFNEFDAFMQGVVNQLLNVQAALFAAVSGTSATSIVIGTGSKTLTLDGADTKAFVAGQRINVRFDAGNYMIGNVDSWNGTTRSLSFTVDDAIGSGAHASWTISLSGDQGPPGAKWYTGSGVPSNSTGIDGDFYLRTTTGDVYTKAAGTWGSPTQNITGPAGATGASGTPGTNGRDGDSGLTAFSQLGVWGI